MQKYLITSREFYTADPRDFSTILYAQLEKHRPQYALYRDKAALNYKETASRFVELCREFNGIKSFLHQDAALAKELNATGVHLTSRQSQEIAKAKSLGLEVIISTHTHKEVLEAQRLGADAVTYSPIFASPDKGAPKGIDDLRAILEECEIKVFALGGIVTQEHLKMIERTKAYGFASIRYFY